MRYMGGKYHTAKWICPILLQLINERKLLNFVDLFCGAVNITCGMTEVPGRRLANDRQADLIALWQAVQTGYTPPHSCTQQIHKRLMATRGQAPDPLRAFVGFGCSYRGKYFGGFDPRGAAVSVRAIEKKRPHLTGVEFTSLDYREVPIPARSLVYCDIPYESTEGYSVGKFDHAEFWHWAERQSRRSTIVVSEYHRNVIHRNVIATCESIRTISRAAAPTTEALVLV